MRFMFNKKLGDMLVESGKITKDQLDYVLKKQKGSRKKIGEIIAEEGFASEDEILDVLHLQLGIDKIDLNNVTINEKAIKLVPENLAKKYVLIPVSITNGILNVAMSDPMNIFAVDDVRISSGLNVNVLIASKDNIKKSIDKYYSGENIAKVLKEVKKQNEDESDVEKNVNTEDLKMQDSINNAPVVKLVDSVIKDAIKLNASDIHIEPFEKYIKIRYRIDGDLQEKQRISINILGSLITRIKILSGMNIAEKRVPQDGRMIIKIDGKDSDMRVSSIPTIYGEKVVIRILSSNNYMLKKEELGMEKDDLEKLNRLLRIPYGIILVTGPTGSGKSTTLYSVIRELNKNDVNIITVEDPVEQVVEGVNQINVNAKAGLTFASGLRSILRQDPDIIMIGEIRDSETAEIAIRAAITGHIVLSTIHTNDAPSTIMRLSDMGVQNYLIGSALSGIIAQRLVKKICPYCMEEYEASEYEKGILNIEEGTSIKLKRGRGCEKCSGSGYKGRTGIYEVMEITKKERELISRGVDTDKLRDEALKSGMKTIEDGCRDLVLHGKTTIQEFMRTAFSYK